ncbi:hypothetical protein IJ22_35620 [Paenibacillus naphthalenovorans]|uniref:Uncharacterized protein n=1 Tax=Paenibacillus naphthalenovorans TaxID=162209 RepID=A0A0U2ULD3_9BACL|nr:hypothetical protein IJ22_35620 [Paenibacillus naphthalenovorans]SDI99130.1 hypothetical protein SAMN05421868_11488 [Paenibacillus naphthalenovorans]
MLRVQPKALFPRVKYEIPIKKMQKGLLFNFLAMFNFNVDFSTKGKPPH